MEETKKTNSNEKPAEQVKNNGDWGGGSCPFWIFGNEESANADLKDKFEIVDEKKD